MYHLVCVRMVEGLGDLGDDVHGTIRRHRSGALRCVGVRAVDELHGDPQLAVLALAAVVDGNDVRVVEASGDVRLAQEAGAEVRVAGQFLREHLQRIVTRQRRVGRQVHGAHSALAELTDDPIARDLCALRQQAT